MGRPVTQGPVQIMLKEPVRTAAVEAAARLKTSVSVLLHEVLAEFVQGASLEDRYIAVLQKRLKTKK